MPLSNELQEVATLLLQGTRAERIKWERTLDSTDYRAVLDSGLAVIGKDERGARTGPSYRLTLRSRDGAAFVDSGWIPENDARTLLALHSLVTERTTSAAIDSFLAELRNRLKP